MPTSPPTTNRIRLRRLCRRRRTLQVMVLAATLCLGATACSSLDQLGDSEAEAPAAPSTHAAITKTNKKSVRSFYAIASEAYRTRDADTLCAMTEPTYVEALVEEAAAAGVQFSTCQELWQSAFAVDPDGHMDRLSDIVVKGKSATFLSDGDPWRVRLVHGEMKIVAPTK